MSNNRVTAILGGRLMTTASAEFASSPLKNIRGIYLVFEPLVKPYLRPRRPRDPSQAKISRRWKYI